MKIISEISLKDFDAWGGAVETKERIIKEGKEEEFEELIEELCYKYPTATEINDYLWFDSEEIFNTLGIENLEDDESNCNINVI